MSDDIKELLMQSDLSSKGLSEESTQKIQEELEKAYSEWDNIGITNDFIFCKIMQDKKLLSELIRRILPTLEFTDIEIVAQKVIEAGWDIHGVRFDIYAKSDDGTVIEIELQVVNQGNLPRRMRYYNSMADSEIFGKGVVYSKLKDCYIIAICPFDFFKQGLHKYTFTNRCHEIDGLELKDGTTKIVLNAVGTADDIDSKLKAFLDYIIGKTSDDEYIKQLDLAVQKARHNKEWRREYMTLYMRDLEKIEEGMEKGREEGIEIANKIQIEKLLRKGKTPEEIADFNDYPIELVKSVEESLLINN